MIETGNFYYGEDKIHYEVVRKEAKNNSTSDKLITDKTKPRKPRKVVIKVHPDQRVVATAPVDATDEVIHDAMMKRASWIWQSLQDFAKQKDHVLPKRYVSGETQFYLGRRYVLKVITDAKTNDRNFFGRTGELLYLMLSRCSQKDILKPLLFDSLIFKNSSWNRMVGALQPDEDQISRLRPGWTGKG